MASVKKVLVCSNPARDSMPSNTPTKRKNTRANFQSEISLDNIKLLIESSKDEIISSLRDDIVCLRNTISSLTDRVMKLEEENKILSNRSKTLKDTSDVPPILPQEWWSAVVKETKQRQLRRRNVIVSGLPEPSSGTVQERYNLNKGACVSIFESLGLFHANIEEVSRHGKPRSDGKRILQRVKTFFRKPITLTKLSARVM